MVRARRCDTAWRAFAHHPLLRLTPSAPLEQVATESPDLPNTSAVTDTRTMRLPHCSSVCTSQKRERCPAGWKPKLFAKVAEGVFSIPHSQKGAIPFRRASSM